MQDVEKKKKENKFTFNDFVARLKHQSASAFLKKIKQFITEVNSSDYTEETSIQVRNFLDSVMQEVRNNPQWQSSSEAELEKAKESIEKYFMSKIYQKYAVFNTPLQPC